MKKFKLFFSMFLSLVFVLPICLIFAGCSKEKDELSMQFKENFKIMQLADVQVQQVAECEDAFLEIDKLVGKEKPDLIVLTGDNTKNLFDQELFDCFMQNMEKYQIPWTSVNGNHDGEALLSKEEIASAYENAKYCLFARGKKSLAGVGNFVINLKQGKEIVYSLFMLDSNLAGVEQSQIDWMNSKALQIKKENQNNLPNSLTFMHIPTSQFWRAHDVFQQDSSIGWCKYYDGEVSQGENLALVEAIKNSGKQKAVLSGHCHGNSGDLLYEDVHWIFGTKSSKYGYHHQDLQGALILTLTKDGFSSRSSSFS